MRFMMAARCLRQDSNNTSNCSIVKASADLPVQEWKQNFAAARGCFYH